MYFRYTRWAGPLAWPPDLANGSPSGRTGKPSIPSVSGFVNRSNSWQLLELLHLYHRSTGLADPPYVYEKNLCDVYEKNLCDVYEKNLCARK